MTSELRIEPVENDPSLTDWQYVHNVIIPSAAMSLDEVRERIGRYRLEVAYLQDDLIGCTTVRPPSEESAAATVIVRVLPEFRRRGLGTQLYARASEQARAMGVATIETIVWAANVDGLRFAQANGFAEIDSYLQEGQDVPFLTLRLSGG